MESPRPDPYIEQVRIFRQKLAARGLLVLVIEGHSGSRASADMKLGDMLKVPKILRDIADDLDRDAARVQQQIADGQLKDGPIHILRGEPGDQPLDLSLTQEPQ